MEIERGEIWWADLPEPRGSEPGYPHPIVIIQSDDFNESSLNTVIGVVLTTNTRLAEMPGNVLLKAGATGLPRDSVANVTQIVTVNKNDLTQYVSQLDAMKISSIDAGLRHVLSL